MTAIDDSEETVLADASDEEALAETTESLFTGGPLAETVSDPVFEPEVVTEEDVVEGNAEGAVALAAAPAALPDEQRSSPMLVERIQERRLRARKVRRLVRHIEPWSVLKVGLLFNFCMWVVIMVAGVLLWNAAETAGTIGDIEQFAEEIFALEEFAFEGEQIFRAVALGGLVLAVAATGFMVLFAILLNLISDLTGGVRVTVVEEETARPISTLPRRG